MDLKTLKTFHLIARLGSFNRAAEALNYAQSTVTMQIRKLEEELGVSLFERGKRIRLTDAGRLFRDRSAPLLRDLERLEETMGEARLGEAGEVRLGATEPTASLRLPAILKAFSADHPNIRVSVAIASTPTLADQVLRGELDLAIGSLPEAEGADELLFEPLFDEEFAALLPDGHPLAGRERLSARELRGERLLITAATCPYRRKLEAVLRESGNLPADTMEIGSMTALSHYVLGGLGVALLPRIVIDAAPAGTLSRPLSEDSRIDMACGLLRHASYPLGRAGERLADRLRKELSRGLEA